MFTLSRQTISMSNLGLPKLFRAAPLTASICWIFAVANMVIALSVYFVYAPSVPISIVGTFFTLKMWGYIFGIMSILGFISLRVNNWNFIRFLLGVGFFIKATWFVALLTRTFQYPQSTIMLTCLWGIVLAVDGAALVFFMPEITNGRDNEQQ